jgi:hypothetical protein
VVSGLRVELRALRATDPGMGLLTAVEFITSDRAHRIVLYRRCSAEDRSVRASGTGEDDPRPVTIASSVAKDLALLERRARAEGFQVQGDETVTPARERSEDGFCRRHLHLSCPTQSTRRRKPFRPPRNWAQTIDPVDMSFIAGRWVVPSVP